MLNCGTDDGLIPLFALSEEILDLPNLGEDWKPVMKTLQALLCRYLDEGLPIDERGKEDFQAYNKWLDDATAHGPTHHNFPTFETHRIESNETNVVPIEPSTEPNLEHTPSDGGPAPITSNVVASDEEVLVVDTGDDTALLQEYYNEAMEHLDSIEGHLLTLEVHPQDSEGLAAVFRAFHTIKGVAGFLQLKPIQRLSHHVESLLDLARIDEVILNSQLITLILKSCDMVKEMTNHVGLALENGSVPDTHFPIAELVHDIECAIEASLQERPEGTPAINISAQEAAAPSAKAKARTTRVSSERIGSLMDVVGELVILESQLTQSAKSAIDSNPLLQRQFSQFQRILKELQRTSMALQMVPIQSTFQRVERIVRDLSQKLGKEIELQITGDDTELDRAIVELIADPLVHMAHNAIDHGLEPSVERQKTGKSAAGNIRLKANHEGSLIVIELSDDGRGIDPKKVRETAIDKGLITATRSLTHEETLQLIFAPGFSTATTLTEQSGRGVGMDVVKRNIESMRGVVTVESTMGEGTTFKVKLPLTTAIIDGLIVRVGGDKFIIPTHSVHATLRPEVKQLTTIANQREMLIMPDRTVPIVRLNNFLGITGGENDPTKATLTVVESAGKHYALMVDEMINKQEVVIKPLGGIVGQLQGIAGGAILGDGSIALILDPATLVKEEVA